MLQAKLSGPDQTAVSYTAGYDDKIILNIPTRIINTNQYYLPGIKIDNVLRKTLLNLVSSDETNRRVLASNAIIEGEISSGKATLSTKL